MEHKEKLARSQMEGMASYGAVLTIRFSDGDDLDTLTEQLISEDLRSGSLIHNLVKS